MRNHRQNYLPYVSEIEAQRRKDARTVTLTIAFVAVTIGALVIVALDMIVWRP